MNMHYIFQVNHDADPADAAAELSPLLSHLYEVEDPSTGEVQMGGYAEGMEQTVFDHAHLIQSDPVKEIDWLKQWEQFSPHFRDGIVEFPLESTFLKLKPGGGFGDFSHPTTYLALELLKAHVKNKIMIDIGCGSGVLAIAAVLMGAKRAIGIDIDPIALTHSKENAVLNGVEKQMEFCKEIHLEQFSKNSLVIALNMILSEQKIAWESHPILHTKSSIIITSGILAAERKNYLQQTKKWGWILVEERSQNEWLGFIFILKQPEESGKRN